MVPAVGGEARQLTDFSFDISEPVWSADGRTLFVAGDTAQDIPEVRQTRDVYAVPRDGGEPRKLTGNPGSESAPAVSPDGSLLAFLSTPETGSETDLLVVEIGPDGAFRGVPRNLTPDWDLDPGEPMWARDGRTLRFASGIGGNAHLFEVPVAGGAVQQATAGDRQMRSFSFSADGTVMAYTATDADSPTEVSWREAMESASSR